MSASGIYGLSGSGIDVESMVKMGMMSKQNEYDKMYKKQVKNGWTKEAYANIYSDLQTFNNSKMSSYKLSSKTMPMGVSSSDTGVATATANANAAAMSHTMEVKSLASNAYLLTKDKITRLPVTNDDGSLKESKSIYLSDIIDTSNWGDDDSISLTIGDGSSDTKEIKITKEQIVTNKQTLNDLAAAFKNAGLNITASYDATNDAFTIYNKEGGSENTISITANNDDSKKLMTALGLASVTTDYSSGSPKTTIGEPLDFVNGDAKQEIKGTDAEVVIDGKTYKPTTNKITVSNVTYSISAVGTSTLTVSQDTDAVIESVKSFVEDYNKMLDSLNDKYSETSYSDYDVLTQSQEKSMTTDQIDKWNEKAKSGLLYHDENLSKLISAMREAIYTPVDSVDSKYNSMMSIGITSSNSKGHLTLDEDKLKKALAEDPDCVYQLFASSGDVTDANGKSTTDYNKEGVVNRIYDAVSTNMKTMKDYAGTTSEGGDGSTLGTLMSELQTKMSNFKKMMDSYEDILYKKYDAMEAAITQLSASYNYISGS